VHGRPARAWAAVLRSGAGHFVRQGLHPALAERASQEGR